GPCSTGIQRGRMNMSSFHEAEHLACIAADVERLAIELAGEGIQRRHDVGDRPVTVNVRVGRLLALSLVPDAGIRLLDHLFAIVDTNEVVLKNVVVEHVLGRFAQIDDPFPEWRILNTKSHVLVVDRTRGVIVAADTADAARDEVRIARILVLHENAVAAENRRRAVALGDPPVLEIDLRKNSEATHDTCDRVPAHFDETFGGRQNSAFRFDCRRHRGLLSWLAALYSLLSVWCPDGATSALCSRCDS